MKDYYKILGVSRDASTEEIKKRFRKRAQEVHPDKSGEDTSAQFMELFEAYSILSEGSKRKRYNLLYEFIDTDDALTNKPVPSDILAIQSSAAGYAKDFNRFDKEVLSLIVENVPHIFDRLVFVSLFAFILGIITTFKGFLILDIGYILIGIVVGFIGLYFGVLKINWNNSNWDRWKSERQKRDEKTTVL